MEIPSASNPFLGGIVALTVQTFDTLSKRRLKLLHRNVEAQALVYMD
jgi:hypothetical protein